MLLYAIVGIPELNRDADLASDYVNPLNRIIWLGLLGLAAPIALVARWRSVLSLLGGSWPLLLLYAYFYASTFWALDPDASTRRLLFTVVQLLLAVVVLSGLRQAATLHILLAAVCVVAAVEDLAAWALWPGYAMTSDGFAGLQLQKNQTGLLMMYGCLAAATAFFLVRGRLARWAIGGSIALMGLLLVATRSTTSQSIVLMAPVAVPFHPFRRAPADACHLGRRGSHPSRGDGPVLLLYRLVRHRELRSLAAATRRHLHRPARPMGVRVGGDPQAAVARSRLQLVLGDQPGRAT